MRNVFNKTTKSAMSTYDEKPHKKNQKNFGLSYDKKKLKDFLEYFFYVN